MLSDDDIRADDEAQAAAEDLDRQEAAQAQDFCEPHMDCRKGRAARQKAADKTRGRYQDGVAKTTTMTRTTSRATTRST